MKEWTLIELGTNAALTANEKAMWIRGVKDVSSTQSRLGIMLTMLAPQLLELELATLENDDLRIKYADYVTFEERGIDAFNGIFPKSPLTLEIRSMGALGWKNLRYNYQPRFYRERVSIERYGCFIKFESKIYELDRQTFALLDAIDNFNDAPPEIKESSESFLKFAEIKGLANGVGATLDRFLTNRHVIVPSEIAVDLIVEDDERISFAPKLADAPADSFWKAFKQSGSVSEIYDLTDENGEKFSVVLSDTQREVLRRMQTVRHLGGAEKTEVLRNPQAVFDGVLEAVNLEGFGPRVRGIGDFPFAVQPFVRAESTGIFDDAGNFADAEEESKTKLQFGLSCKYADGNEEKIQFATSQQVTDFCETARIAYKNGAGQIQFQGKSIILDDSLMKGLDELVQIMASKDKPETQPSSGKYLLIYTNEDEIEFETKGDDANDDYRLRLPDALKPNVTLKEHQKRGIEWLQRNFELRRQGCLLADDMGLGKTLQILTFLAWLIEKGDVVSDNANSEKPPFNPILIIAPVILIENETWIGDMKKFFKFDGSIFTPFLTLRGKELQSLKKQRGQETKLGESILDLDELRMNRVVLTNYETIVNYQHSFAKMREHWSIVVTDEAQEYKTPNTKISHALKSLSPRFRVACTGTPVETRLLDVWNIFDFLQPGNLLGSAKQFQQNYEKPLSAVDETQNALSELKEKLKFGRKNAFVLRRDKSELTDLPTKTERRITCGLSPKQRELHLNLMKRVAIGGEGNHPFQLIHNFLHLYQHPSLIPHYEPCAANQAVSDCDKLRVLLETLHEIRRKSEKALIFTRSLNMQQILVSVLNDEFGLSVEIVNGATSGKSQLRRGIIKRFQESYGFNILILSPEVAGTGLTLVEANHVFHYGRWWNPAKESQATDRVYRIGQTKDVQVYYLIAKDAEQKFLTFDEKLDDLLRKRHDLATNFLAPMPPEEELKGELLNTLFS